jgi:acid phosphatase (class A)
MKSKHFILRAECRRARHPVLIAVIAFALGACATNSHVAGPPVRDIGHGMISGYLAQEALPDSLAILLPPPQPGSPAFTLDEAVAHAAVAVRGTPRWNLAMADADLSFPHAADTFTCALGATVSETAMPHLYLLLRRTLTDAALSTLGAKNHYKRTRPFMVDKEPTCSPNDEEFLRNDGSYPSGHTTIGWAWALILAEIAPDEGNAIIARGLSFGASRNVCNVHWFSDVLAGRTMGAAVVARLHADPGFRGDLAGAKDELAKARAHGMKPARDCVAEAAALAQ